jgi:hypothetical protein
MAALPARAVAADATLHLPGTLYVEQKLLDDCPDGCLIYTGSRMLWRASLAGDVPCFRGLMANSDPAPALQASVSPQGDMMLFADRDQHRHMTIAPVNLMRMVFAGPGVAIAGSPRPTGPLGEYAAGGPDPTVQLSSAWSPDGAQIAFAGQVHGALGIWIAARSGTGWRRLPCRCDAFGFSVDWSVTGLLAFDGGSGERSAIWAVNADGSSLRRLTAPPKGLTDFGAKWSPDGTRLAFVRGSADGLNQLEVLDLRTGLLKTIAKNAQSPVWSPDGTELAYIDEGVTGALGGGSSESVRVVSNAGAPVGRLRLPDYVATWGYVDGLIWRAADDASGDAPTGALAVYSSLALTGARSGDGTQALRGEQLALADASGTVDGRPAVLQSLSNTPPGGHQYSYDLTVANALRAAEDPNAVGYIGEDASEASEDSMPILNEAGVAQISWVPGRSRPRRSRSGRDSRARWAGRWRRRSRSRSSRSARRGPERRC